MFDRVESENDFDFGKQLAENAVVERIGGCATPGDADTKERPLIARQTSLKELTSSSRKSCEAIPEETKESDGGRSVEDPVDLPPLPRERVYTMPSLNVRRTALDHHHPRRTSEASKTSEMSGTNPSFMFLQLYYSPMTSVGKEGSASEASASLPILVPNSVQTAIKNLDRIPPFETHKIGVLYVGKGQANKEGEILSNEHGSVRYMEFLSKLGQLISLSEVTPFFQSRPFSILSLNPTSNPLQFSYQRSGTCPHLILSTWILLESYLNPT